MSDYGYSIGRCGQFGWEWFAGLHAGTGEPLYSEKVTDAQIWENKLHAESQALLLMCQRKAIRVSRGHEIMREELGKALNPCN